MRLALIQTLIYLPRHFFPGGGVGMAEQEIGRVSHYFAKIGVGVIELTAQLNVGDRIRVEAHAGNFEQPVDSMQFDHKPLMSAAAGQSIGLKLAQAAHEGNKVFKI